MMRASALQAVYEAGWLATVLMFIGGWALSFTSIGAALVVAATVSCVALLAARRTPNALMLFAVVMSFGWFPLFLTAPWLLAVPAALLAVTWRWRQRANAAQRR